MRIYIIILTLVGQLLLCATGGMASQADIDWQQAVRTARAGDADFAYMDFWTIAELYPHTRWAMQAEFAQGEYYFLQHNLRMASETFQAFTKEYPKRQEALIALAYLFKMAQIQHNTEALKMYRAKAASFNQMTFVFNEKKSYSFVSGFRHRHKLVFTIKAIELYVEEKLFTYIPI